MRRTAPIALLLFGSGACALAYQVAWLRELRLIFGASTPASAAVLAIFMGGLGLGSAVLGRRAERSPRPLALYARLEILVAISAAATPLAVLIARRAYAALGGTTVLGPALGTVARLLISVVVLGVPTFLMGGTLPAAARAVETGDDVRRRRRALLYGANTLGAVVGATVASFWLLETIGTRRTLWVACAFNAGVALLAAWLVRRGVGSAPVVPAAHATAPPDRPATPARLAYAASALVGFVFLLMELVWYRMLAPLLGGSSYTFGLILAIALLGIGLGGAAYALLGADRPATARGLALTCALEALLLALPFALGDRLALVAIALRSLRIFGFAGYVAGWSVIAAIAVLPAAFLSGVQFPLLVALLGRGRTDVARHVGLAYAWNTAGAIAGSLAGGFLLLPLLTAQGAWRLSVVALVVIAAGALFVDRRGAARGSLVAPAIACVVALALAATEGPTAVWRHSPIGAGRVDAWFAAATPIEIEGWLRDQRRDVVWEADGVEAGLALEASNSFNFVVNGKSDGSAWGDAPTQVMGGLVGAMLHRDPQSALVIGLGTGSTAGWLAAVPSVKSVDVVELEPAIVHVAKACHAVNHEALDDPKIHLTIGDAREVLLTTPRRYDVIFSEPSNPYRAGISSLFTAEFYDAVRQRLGPGGVFVQWLQAYEIDATSVASVYATLASVFPHVETWRAKSRDLLLVAAADPLVHDVAALRARAKEEPYRSAMLAAWRVDGLEGFLAHHLGRASLARAVAATVGPEGRNLDDRNLLEFALARSVGRALFDVRDLARLAAARGEGRPDLVNGQVDQGLIDDWRAELPTLYGAPPDRTLDEATRAPDSLARVQALGAWVTGDLEGSLRKFRSQPGDPRTAIETTALAEALADRGDEAAQALIDRVRAFEPTDADALVARLRFAQGRTAEATVALEATIAGYQRSPWAVQHTMVRTLALAPRLAATDRAAGRRIFERLATPFAAEVLRLVRQQTRLELARFIDARGGVCVEAFAAFEPHVLWHGDFLAQRARCYDAADSPLLARAVEDVATFEAGETAPFGAALRAQLRGPAR